MTLEEYEDRKRQLEAEHRRGVEMLADAHRAQLHALEVLWLGDGAPEPSREIAAAAPARAAKAPSGPGSAQMYEDVKEALGGLPEVFTTPELTRVLGYSPHRGSLHRVLGELEKEGLLRTELRGDGRRLSRLRRLSPPRPAAATGQG